ncbi:MAG: methylated-DNA--[protein]-cysteine S-methyltransferase [Candidatus Rokuibacteriota bacterium]
MNRRPNVCAEIEPDLIAAATGEAEPATASRVQQHIRACPPCGTDYAQYRAIDQAVGVWRQAPTTAGDVARKRLEIRLGDLKRRTFTYRVFPSPLGNILIALSEQGVSLVEYLGRSKSLAQSRLGRMPGVETIEDGAELEALSRELIEYLEGKRTRLEWPLDLRLARSDFHRTVLQATAEIPYGAVMSYAGVACEVGKPSATRAVAQALRWNPLPIVIPCHRVIGTSGALTGYAGNKVDLKQRLLTTEGIRVGTAHHAPQVAPDAMYVGEPNDQWYCLPTCSSLESLQHPSRLLYFGSRERAEALGREPCSTCRPDLHPIAH